jgi:transcriptional/translational regulatory protein YebC/TACO1
VDEDTLMEYALEAGAEDIDSSDEEVFIVKTTPSDFSEVLKALEDNSVEIKKSSIELIPQNKIIIDDVNKANQVIKFIDALEDDDDVQHVYSNFDISDDVLQQLS